MNPSKDNTWARSGANPIDGTNTYTAVAKDAYGRSDTNTVSVFLPVSASFTYDLNGNLLSDGRRAFDYDDENQLIRVTITNATRSDFVYDGKMRRRERIECTWNGSAWVTNESVHYIYDGNLVLQERHYNNPLPGQSTATAGQLVTYTRGKDLSGSLQGAGGTGGLLARSEGLSSIASGGGGSTSYYHSDGNGNITCLINVKSAIVAKYHYDPYGNMISASGPLAEANLYRFSSKEWHAQSGLVYYLYRFYEPNLQRWVNRDPLEDGGSLVYAVSHFDPEEDLGLSSFQIETVEGPNLYAFVANDPVGLWDGFGTSKGGKQNISCEGFTKKSCPEDVAKALEEAKKLKQAKRIKALRGLLKVIKRGGGRMFFWIEYYLELLNQSCGGGQPVMAYNETHDNNMTSDGISTEDWEIVQDYAARIANAACSDDEATSQVVTEKLLRYLECLEAKYGKLPTILATRADYATDLSQRVQLLEQAYELARQSGDKENLTLAASSLAQLFVEEAADASLAQKWLALLGDALGDKWDDLEHQEFQKLTAQVENLKQGGKPGSLA